MPVPLPSQWTQEHPQTGECAGTNVVEPVSNGGDNALPPSG
nr:MAG TPA: hypothetical protein [Caudoviricetes sp.]